MFTIAKYTYRDITKSFYFNFIGLLGAFLLYILPYMLFFYFQSYNLAFRDISLSTIYSFVILTAVISFPYNIHTEMTGDYLFLIFSKPISRTTYLLGKLLGFAKSLLILWIFLTLILTLSIWKIEGNNYFERTIRDQISSGVYINAFTIIWNYAKVGYIPVIKIAVLIYLYVVSFSALMLLWLVHFKFMTNILFSIVMIFIVNIIFSLPSNTLKTILGLLFPDIGIFDFFYFNKFIYKYFNLYSLKITDSLSIYYLLLVLLKTFLYCSFYVIISSYIWGKKEIKVSD